MQYTLRFGLHEFFKTVGLIIIAYKCSLCLPRIQELERTNFYKKSFNNSLLSLRCHKARVLPLTVVCIWIWLTRVHQVCVNLIFLAYKGTLLESWMQDFKKTSLHKNKSIARVVASIFHFHCNLLFMDKAWSSITVESNNRLHSYRLQLFLQRLDKCESEWQWKTL